MANDTQARGALAIEVRGLCKSFRVPIERVDTLKGRATHPFRGDRFRELTVLDEISFEVGRGEFFGVVGRNGSGKSTLLKLLASIYRADRGRIRVAGTIAPIIELGVGFQPEFSARDNVITNALMLGLTPREARRRFDQVIEFAELEEFVDMKLKNYSSGMRVRLAFAIAVQAQPDVLLLDEVLAVGDPPFQERCNVMFQELKDRQTTTVVLVTHAMRNVERYCDRAILLEAGRIGRIGEPVDVARAYHQLSGSANPALHRGPTRTGDSSPRGLRSPEEAGEEARRRAPSRIVELKLLDSSGTETDLAEPGRPLHLYLRLDAEEALTDPRLALRLADRGGTTIFAPPPIALGVDGKWLGSGRKVAVAARIENKLAPGKYAVHVRLASGPRGSDAELSEPAILRFHVPRDGGGDRGLVVLDRDFRTRPEPPAAGRGDGQLADDARSPD